MIDNREFRKCPYCNTPCEADWVNVEVAYAQVGPFHCSLCGASEIGLYDKPRSLTEKEKEYGWYGPSSEPGSSSNVINGRIVSSSLMTEVYRDRFYQSPAWEKDEVVKDFFDNIRKGK